MWRAFAAIIVACTIIFAYLGQPYLRPTSGFSIFPSDGSSAVERVKMIFNKHGISALNNHDALINDILAFANHANVSAKSFAGITPQATPSKEMKELSDSVAKVQVQNSSAKKASDQAPVKQEAPASNNLRGTPVKLPVDLMAVSGARSRQQLPPQDALRSLILKPEKDACSKFKVLHPPSPDTPIPEPDMKICLSNLRDPCKAFSIGINYQWDFDDFALKIGCYVWSFDPSMRPGNYKRGPKHTFEHVGIADSDGVNKGASTLYTNNMNYRIGTLKTLMATHGCDYLDIVRMDVEGAEWSVLEQWNRDWVWPRIGQLLLEIHMWNRGKSAGGVPRWAKVLNAIPMRVMHTAQNKHSMDQVTVGLTSVWELGMILPEQPDASKRRLSQMEGIDRRPTFSDFNGGRLLSDIIDDLFK